MSRFPNSHIHLQSFILILLFFSYLTASGQTAPDFNVKEINPFPGDVHGFAINPNDSALYFTSFYTGDLCKLDYPYNTTYTATGITGQRLAGLLWLKQSLFVADLAEGKINEYDEHLKLLKIHNVPNPWNMTTDGQSIYVVTFNGELYKIFNQQITLLKTGLAYPFDIEYSPDNTLYISEQFGSNTVGRVSEYDLNGNLLHILPNTFDTPLGITFDAKGNLFAIDNNTNCISCITPDGTTNLVTCNYDNPIAIIPNLENKLFISSASSGGTLLEITTVQATSLEEQDVSNLLVYPNPASDQLYISMSLEHQAKPEVAIYSYTGQQIQIEELNQLQRQGKLEISIGTKNLNSGNYFVEIGDSRFRVVKQFSISR